MSRDTRGRTHVLRDIALAFMPIPGGILLVFLTLVAGIEPPHYGTWPLSDVLPIYAAEIPFLVLAAFVLWRANGLRSRAYWIGFVAWGALNAGLYFLIGTIHP